MGHIFQGNEPTGFLKLPSEIHRIVFMNFTDLHQLYNTFLACKTCYSYLKETKEISRDMLKDLEPGQIFYLLKEAIFNGGFPTRFLEESLAAAWAIFTAQNKEELLVLLIEPLARTYVRKNKRAEIVQFLTSINGSNNSVPELELILDTLKRQTDDGFLGWKWKDCGYLLERLNGIVDLTSTEGIRSLQLCFFMRGPEISITAQRRETVEWNDLQRVIKALPEPGWSDDEKQNGTETKQGKVRRKKWIGRQTRLSSRNARHPTSRTSPMGASVFAAYPMAID